jgi:hypothetical protein
MPNAGYYFMQNACEPIHIQLNLNDLKVLVINRTYKKIEGLTARIDILGLDSRSLFHEEKNISLSETDVRETSTLSAELKEATGVRFVVLNLKNSIGNVISHNVYWLSNNGDYKALNDIQKTMVEAKVISSAKGINESSWTIQISNQTDKIAFFMRSQLFSGGEEILPSYWTANYFTLAPSETIKVTVSCPAVRLKNVKPVIRISGWNAGEQELTLN